jgi:hypothetical protein
MTHEVSAYHPLAEFQGNENWSSRIIHPGPDLSLILQDGTGAVARPLHAKINSVVSPMDFAAIGDGVANDQAKFTLLETAFPDEREIDLEGRTYLVTTIPTGHIYKNGAFKVGSTVYPTATLIDADSLTDDLAALQAIMDKLAGTVKALHLSNSGSDLQAITDKLAGTGKAGFLSSTAADLQAITTKLQYLPGGTGAVSRTVSGKLRESISVTDYNVLAGDGTTDARAAIALAMANSDTLFTAGTYRVASNITITGTIRFAKGAMLKPASGVTITIAGSIEAGMYQIFDLSLGGAIISTESGVNTNPVTTAYPDWWGTPADRSTAIQAAINFIQSKAGGTVQLNGWYNCYTTLFVSGRVRIEGTGPSWGIGITDIARNTVLDFSGATSGTGGIHVQNGTGEVNGFQLNNVGILRNPVDAAGVYSVGIHLIGTKHYTITDCSVHGFSIGFQTDDNSDAGSETHDGIVTGNIFGASSFSTVILGGCAGLTFRDCTIFSSVAFMSQIVLIGRGVNGMPANTVAFEDSRILFLGPPGDKPPSLVKITDGMWISFERCDVEESTAYGILIERDATAGHHDLSLKSVIVNNCWFNGCGMAVYISGYRANCQISNNRMENQGIGTINVAVQLNTQTDCNTTIYGNNIRVSGTVAGIYVNLASSVLIWGNHIWGDGTGLGTPGIALGGFTSLCGVSNNRVRSNSGTPIYDVGAGNNIDNNLESAV